MRYSHGSTKPEKLDMKLQSHHHVQEAKLSEFSDSVVHSALPPMWRVLLITYWAFVKFSNPCVKARNTIKGKEYLGRCMPQKLSKRPNITKKGALAEAQKLFDLELAPMSLCIPPTH
jgi:hypothetical protein